MTAKVIDFRTRKEIEKPVTAVETIEIAKFETGKTYTTRSACDYECVFSFTVTRRTAKSIWIVGDNSNKPERRKIDIYDNMETVYPLGKYSMAPIIRA